MIEVFCDGSCKRTPTNPIGPMSWAWLITDDGITRAHGAVLAADGTHVEAEYRGVLAGLRALQALGHVGPARLCGDNAVVINQVAGRWQCQADSLVPFYHEAAALVADLVQAGCQVELVLIGRAGNLADALLRPPLQVGRRDRKAGRLTVGELATLLAPAAGPGSGEVSV